jgi:hypothetical protein
MKKLLFVILIACCSLLNCDDNAPQDGFEMLYIQDFTIFAGLNTIETHVFEFDITTNFQNYLTEYGLTIDDIETIVPSLMIMTNVNGNQTYDILSRVRLFTAKEDGTHEFETAFNEPVPANTQYDLQLLPTLVQVKDVLSENKFKIKLKLNFRAASPISIDTRLNMTFQAILK